MRKLRILYWGIIPWATTGYGVSCRNITRLLREKHEVAIFSHYGLKGRPINYDGFIIFPNPSDSWGVEWVPYWFKKWQADVILQHFDALAIGGAISEMGLPLVSYSPVDCEPLPPATKAAVQRAVINVCETHFAEKVYHEAGITNTYYVPDHYDPKIYFPRDKAECRSKFGLPHDRLIFGAVATNYGPRKNLANLLKGYSIFLERNPEARDRTMLYLHCYPFLDGHNPLGYNLAQVWEQLGIGKNVAIPDPMDYAAGYPEEKMGELIASFDWYLATASGEGFGLPILFSMACGVPVIYNNYSAMPEIVADAGLALKPGEPYYIQTTFGWQVIPSTEDIAQKMEVAYKNPDLQHELGQRALNRAQENYSEKVVAPMWFKLFEEIEEKIW